MTLNFTLLAYSTGCVFYNASLGDFDSAGCRVGLCSSPLATQCICSHLTSFSNTFKTPKIRFDSSAFSLKKLDQNPVAFSFCIGCICVYLVLFIYCRRKDLDDRNKAGVLSLPDNDPSEKYGYEVTIWTGMRAKSGTSSRVAIVLSGDDADSEARTLSVPNTAVFQRGSIDAFLLTTPKSLGNLGSFRFLNSTNLFIKVFLNYLLIRWIERIHHLPCS